MTEKLTALITGVSSGIGLACARRLLRQDYQVIGISRRPADSILNHDNFKSIQLDLSQPGGFDSVWSGQLKGQPVQCFIHCAGQGHFGSVEQFSSEQIESSIRLNLTSAITICRYLIPVMRRQKQGQVVFMGSESALTAGQKGALYSAAKFGLRGFSQALRADCASDGIRVSLVNAGMVRSPFFDNLNFTPGPAAENAIEVEDVSDAVWQILITSSDIVIDEINLSPRVKSINFNKK